MLMRRVFVSFAFAMISGITIQSSAFSQEYQGTYKRHARQTFGGYVARKFPLSTRSWLACGKILRNSAIGVVRFLHNAMRPHAERIATTGKGVTSEIMGSVAMIEIMSQGGLTTGSTGQSRRTVQGPTITTTNK
jgi:hypothetical protein